jgi:hypothetical protein
MLQIFDTKLCAPSTSYNDPRPALEWILYLYRLGPVSSIGSVPERRAIMTMKAAILTGVTGLILNAGLGSAVYAQPIHRYRSVMARRYAGGEWRAEQMVRQAYLDILRREPDPSGLQEYTDAILNRGWTYGDLRRSLLNSPEYAQHFGVARSRWGWRNR